MGERWCGIDAVMGEHRVIGLKPESGHAGSAFQCDGVGELGLGVLEDGAPVDSVVVCDFGKLGRGQEVCQRRLVLVHSSWRLVGAAGCQEQLIKPYPYAGPQALAHASDEVLAMTFRCGN